MSTAERAYLTIVEWPAEFDEHRRLEALVAASGADPAQARLAVRQAPPMIALLIGRIDRTPILSHLNRQGVLAIAPTRAELARMPPPIAAKGLAEAIGSEGRLYMVEVWRTESQGLRTQDIRLLVRASLRRSITTTRADRSGSHYGSLTAHSDAETGFFAGALSGSMTGEGTDRSTRLHTTEILDIYTADKRRIRINSDKFGFDVLGAERSYTDGRNTDLLAIRLAERSPSAFIDNGFATFRPPADVRLVSERSAGAGTTRSRSDAASFDFYSPWFALTYAALLKSTRSG